MPAAAVVLVGLALVWHRPAAHALRAPAQHVSARLASASYPPMPPPPPPPPLPDQHTINAGSMIITQKSFDEAPERYPQIDQFIGNVVRSAMNTSIPYQATK
jgi:hypothetical protein